MNRSRSLIFLLVMFLVGMLVGACGSLPDSGSGGQSPATPSEGESPLTLVDARGRTVEFAQAPQRIVVAGRSSLTAVEALFLFPEAKDRLVGLVVGKQDPGDFLRFVDPGFDQKAVLETESGPEQIAPLDPDVVVLRSFMAESLGAPLEQLEIPVVYLDLETPEQYFRGIATLGSLFGNEARAQEIEAYYQSMLDAINQDLAGLDQGQRPGVLILQYTDQGGEVALNMPSAAWIQTIEAELAGGEPVWKDAAQSGGWTVVNFEQIAAWDPDKLFVVHYGGDPAGVVDQLQTNPQWQMLGAVQAGEIYGFASDIFSWDQPDPRWILGTTWLAGKIHPDRFEDLDMQEQVIDFFQQMYGMDKASVEQNILPTLKGDVE